MRERSGHSDRNSTAPAQGAEPTAASGTAAAESPCPLSLIESIVEATDASQISAAGREAARAGLQEFLGESSPWRALLYWITPRGGRFDKRQIAQKLSRDIARIDALLSRQVNAILHHPQFQKLEGSWRGLRYLVDQAEGADNVKIRVLSVSWKELARDFERAIEFDCSQLFRKVYTEEFGMPGGEPFGVLLGDYELWPRPCEEHPIDDLEVLRAISGVAAAAFAPFVTGVHPAFFGMNDFVSLQQPLNLPATFDQREFLKWRSFRETPDARFVGLTLPRVLMRLPHEDDGSRIDGFGYREEVAGPDHGKYLWGNATYAFGAVLIRSFGESAWLADIRGVRRDVEGGGLVTGLPVHSFSTDKLGVAPKCSTDVIISGLQEQELSELGFIPLCHCADTEFSAFYATQSAQESKKYDSPEATVNARISAMLQYTLCVSLFAHYLKVAARDKIGNFTEASECEAYLNNWFSQYVTSDTDATPEVKAEYPLRQADVRVFEQPGRPGSYHCIARLWPHFELDELATTLTIKTVLTPSQSG